MAFSGKITAANHADLLAKVTNFITGDPGTPGRDWTVARLLNHITSIYIPLSLQHKPFWLVFRIRLYPHEFPVII